MSLANMNFLLGVGKSLGIIVNRNIRFPAHKDRTAAMLLTRSIHASAVARSKVSSTGPEKAVCTKKPASSVQDQQGAHPLFDKLLVANRGEIAIRVMKTCRNLGIKTVAIHSEVDLNCLHVRMADEAYCVGPAPTNSSYRNVPAILDAIKQSGAQAVHPGYGFLSENCDFAADLEKLGVAWVGPNSHSIEAMGDKLHSKALAKEAKVSTIPGYAGVVNDAEEAVKIAKEIGYPVMVKASAGGGGKGMRVAWNDDEVRDGFRLSSAEAASSFGDDRLLVEKFIDNPRHIEIQVLGDKHGNVIYLNERECSIQRRNQKVIEEAPSSFIDPATRKAMGEQAVMLSKAVKYDSAGTCEFLVDSQKNFYFLEMNTRLQVEHPITEMITGVDIVEQMIRSAKGLPLVMTQEQVPINGWAFESRVYAEDPTRFLPSIGRLSSYVEPTNQSNQGSVRCDSGIIEGSEISIYYDPMICKLITHGNTRQEALELMREALDTYVIKGVTHNIPIIRDILDKPDFISGDISTKFIPKHYPEGFSKRNLDHDQVRELVSSAVMVHYSRLSERSTFLNSRQIKESQSVVNREIEHLVASIDGNAPMPLAAYPQDDDSVLILFGENDYVVAAPVEANDNSIVIRRFSMNKPCSHNHEDGVEHEHHSDQCSVIVQELDQLANGYRLRYLGSVYDVTLATPKQSTLSRHMPKKVKPDSSLQILSPMPGTVISISVKPGDSVIPGQEVAVVEAMKMQNSLRAQRVGKVKAVHVTKGQTLQVEQLMIEFEAN